MILGAEYFNPRPEAINHFVSVFVYHSESKTLHVDDTLVYIKANTWPINLLLQPGSLIFHPSIIIGLNPDSEAPLQFYNWMNQMLEDWNFDNLCTAHVNNDNNGWCSTCCSAVSQEFREIIPRTWRTS